MTATPCKPDDDLVNDSFHTASGSPDSSDGTATGKPSISADTETKEAVTQEECAMSSAEHAESEEHSESVAIPTSPDSPVSPKTIKKVHIPQFPVRARLASASSSSTAKPEALEPPQSSAPSISPALPTPAYFTAPNTPAAPQHALKVESEEEVQPLPPQSKKEKGPAQTESFSLFGKKKEKKPKKKGTLKGKPKDGSAASDVASDSMSRVVSGASTPSIDNLGKEVS